MKEGLEGTLYGIEIMHNMLVGDTREHDDDFKNCWCWDKDKLFKKEK